MGTVDRRYVDYLSKHQEQIAAIVFFLVLGLASYAMLQIFQAWLLGWGVN